MNNDLCLHCGASLHFNDETGMFCPACAQQKDAMQAAWEATRRDANEAAKQRQAADRALAATEAERLARSLRGEQMPPPFAVCEGHEKRLEAIEQKLDRLGLDGMAEAVMKLLKRVADLEAVNEAEYADERKGAMAWAAAVGPNGYAMSETPTPTLCPVVTRVEVRDHYGRCLFFAAPANDVDLRYSDDGKTLTVVLKR